MLFEDHESRLLNIQKKSQKEKNLVKKKRTRSNATSADRNVTQKKSKRSANDESMNVTFPAEEMQNDASQSNLSADEGNIMDDGLELSAELVTDNVSPFNSTEIPSKNFEDERHKHIKN